MLLKYSALTLQAISRRRTAIGQLSQAFEFILILLLVDIYIYVCLLGNLQRILHLKAVTARNSQASYQLIYIG